MRTSTVTVALVAAVLLLPTATRAQSLAEAAAKEKERRKAKVGHTFTEEDLRRAGATRPRESAAAVPDAAPPEAAGGAKEGKEGAPKAKTPDEIRADQEKAWHERLAKANEDVTRLSGQIDTIQRGLNDLSQPLYGPARTTQLGRLEEAKSQLAAAQQSIADLQEEGRRSSYR
jgi:hypothetical protein